MPVFSPAPRGRLGIPPPALLALFYAGLVAAGTLILKLPGAAAAPISWGDAAFTALSAACVTGLVVVDTGSGFTLFGQAVILVLIQLGGLGLMTFAVLVLSMLGRDVHMSHQVLLREDLNQTSVSELIRLVRGIGAVALVCEGLGAAALATVFVPESGWAQGLWQAVFHAVSAFNNAGFSLFPDSLSRWVADPVVNLAVPALIIVGGIGFKVIAELRERRGWRRLSLHSKLTLAGTAALLLLGTLGFAALEWTNPATLGGLESWPARLGASWFQSVTTRTAGFNTVPIGELHDSTSLMTMVLMVVGGGATSTAGGVKVTTLVVLLLATAAFFRARRAPRAFGRSLEFEDVQKVLALITVSGLIITATLFVASVSHDGDFLDLAFEATSAFGTVGLSRGATGELDGIGRAAIMLLMFLGRVGPLTLGFMLASRVPSRIRYPAGRVLLG